MQPDSLTFDIQDHYRRCAQAYLHWSGEKGGGYHFGFPLHWREVFYNSKMVANATYMTFDRLGISSENPCSILDAGCGSGEGAMLFKKKFPLPSQKIWGVTLSHEQVRQGRKQLENSALNDIYLETGDFNRLRFPSEFFDYILFNNSLCYSPGPAKTLALTEAARVLKPGGKIAFYDVLLSQPEKRFPFWWRISNKILKGAWAVPIWPEINKMTPHLDSLGLKRTFEKDMKWAIVPSVLSMAIFHLPLFFWKALTGKISWYEVGVLMRLVLTAPIVGIHTHFHHPLIVWQKK